METTSNYMKPSSAEIPRFPTSRDVFFDPSGHRWRLVKVNAALITVFLVLIIVVSWTPIQQPPNMYNGGPKLPQIAVPEEGYRPTIGAGPLVRLVRVVNQNGNLAAVDPFTNQPLSAITGDDAETVGDAPYALQQYGYSSAAHKTIELTFDDGPDPTWTPKILDLLSKYKAPATFFVIGSEVVKYPSIVVRETREGHTIGNHTLTHPDLTPDEVQEQFVSTDRIIRAVTGVATNLIRMPYDSSTTGAKGFRDAQADAVLIAAERLHYVDSMEEFDTGDWKYGDPATRPKSAIPLPPSTMDNITVLLHDGGGDRSHTLAYLQRLLPWALAHGYSFHSLAQVSPQVVSGTTHVTPSMWDTETMWMYSALFSWSATLSWLLFAFAIVVVVAVGGLNTLLAVGRHARHRGRFAQYSDDGSMAVSIVVAAFNEEKVIGRTLEALRRSRYANIREVIVVDDGSTDRTADVVAEIAASDPRIKLMRQENAGKAAALNRAFIHARSPIVVTLDADTLFTPTTIGNLVRHFTLDKRGRLGAVAGVIKVGNRRNLLTRWQALEYATMIGIDRGAQDALHAIMVVPGACAAWRRKAVLRVGGYSRRTLAEDCDLALDLHQEGYLVVQDDEAVSYTEAPETARALARQRYRWMYGNIQAIWKHRGMILNPRYGWLGMLTMPLAVISLVLPAVFMPFVYVMAVITFEGQGWGLVLLYVALFFVVQFLTAAIGIWLVREPPSHLLIVPIYRLIYEPLRAYILYKSILTILRGTRSSWNKLQRKGTVTVESFEQAAS